MGFVKKIRHALGVVPAKSLRRIPIVLICTDNIAYQGQDFAGQPIDRFPMVEIFRLYETDPEAAHEKFERWMRTWLLERDGWRISKLDGGMAAGSLFRTIAELYRDAHSEEATDFALIENSIVHTAIEKRARYYFVEVFESIRDNGYDKSVEPPITYVRENGRYLLKNGHHRAAAMIALGHSDIIIGPHEAWT